MVQCIVEELDDLFSEYNTLRNHPEKFVFEAQQLIIQLKLYDKNHPKIKQYEPQLRTFRNMLQYNCDVDRSLERIPKTGEQKIDTKSLPSEKLQKALSEITETEQVADSTLLELARQRTTILKSQDNISKIKSEQLPKASKTVSNMSKWWRW